MHLLVGNSCMECSDYEGAIQSFERAQAQMRHYTSRALFVISLVSFLTDIFILQRIEMTVCNRCLDGSSMISALRFNSAYVKPCMQQVASRMRPIVSTK